MFDVKACLENYGYIKLTAKFDNEFIELPPSGLPTWKAKFDMKKKRGKRYTYIIKTLEHEVDNLEQIEKEIIKKYYFVLPSDKKSTLKEISNDLQINYSKCFSLKKKAIRRIQGNVSKIRIFK